MYRCRECKAEYKNKVEYCDCGNNTFDYIEEEIPLKPQKQKKYMTLEEKSELISKLFFGLCLIISTLVWLIPVKSDVKPAVKQKPPVTKQKIPDINKIWDDTPIYQSQPQQTYNTKSVNSYTYLADRPATSASKQSKNNTVKKNSSNQAVSKPAAYEIVYNPPPVSKKKEATPKRTEPPKPLYNPNSPQMLKYKGDLRAALFSKFAAGSIPGSGSCEISFSVDKTGKLVNRKFTRESDNKTLNDVVYYMLMSVPKYLPPPAEYNGQTIKMKFFINNGSYEITIN